MVQIESNVPLAPYSTMKLGGSAAYLAQVTTIDDLKEVVAFAAQKNLPVKVIGGGSNIVWQDGVFDGVVMVNKLRGLRIDQNTVTAGAGEPWDEVVAATVEAGLSGMEFLSLIPGSTGAVPVQNVGAYGAEVSQLIELVEVFDKKTNEIYNLRASECRFAYRKSRFNTTDKDRFIITRVTFKLSTLPPRPPFYKGLEDYLDAHNCLNPSAADIREAIIAIRTEKLPDPATAPNCGSFFKNPIISKDKAEELLEKHPTMPQWQTDVGVKVPAAWLLEQAGLKGFYDDKTGMATYEKQSLVVINKHARSTGDLLAFKKLLQQAVEEKFGITLVQEPELV